MRNDYTSPLAPCCSLVFRFRDCLHVPSAIVTLSQSQVLHSRGRQLRCGFGAVKKTFAAAYESYS